MNESQLKTLLEGRKFESAPRVVFSGNHAHPWPLVKLVDETLPEYRLWSLHTPKGVPDREGVILETSFVGVGMRKSPRLSYAPSRLSLVPRIFKTTRKPDIVVVHTTTPRNGKVSLGIEVNVLPGAIEAVKANGGLLIAMANKNMPYTFGDGEIDVEMFDAIVEIEMPLETPPSRGEQAPDVIASAKRIGELVATRVKDGSTMQLGIGEVPDATLLGIQNRKNIGIWTEMFSDGVLGLEKAGALDPNPDRKIVSSFAFGSEELYAWMDNNDKIRLLRTETTNFPGNIARQPMMTSVNTALQIDLFAQANASRINYRIFSGFGGSTDFLVGASHAEGGQAFMALRSWHPKADQSTIVPLLKEPTTSFQHTAVITEQGIADIFGYDEKTQARHLIENAANPKAREWLWEEAAKLGLV